MPSVFHYGPWVFKMVRILVVGLQLFKILFLISWLSRASFKMFKFRKTVAYMNYETINKNVKKEIVKLKCKLKCNFMHH